MSLPPLPKPATVEGVATPLSGGWVERRPTDLFTAEQMREYARAAVAAEREACAKACEAIEARQNDGYDGDYENGIEAGADRCATAIRARGDA